MRQVADPTHQICNLSLALELDRMDCAPWTDSTDFPATNVKASTSSRQGTAIQDFRRCVEKAESESAEVTF